MIITRNELIKIPTPEPTRTWAPVPHIQAVDQVANQIANLGLNIKQERFEITKGGDQLFSTFTLDQQKDGIQWMVGMRNSHNKMFSLGLAAGTHVVVCSNLMFKGDFVDFRRHTRRLTHKEIDLMVKTSMDKIISRVQETIDWHLSLKEVDMSFEEMKIRTFDAMQAGIILPKQFTKFNASLQEERQLNGDTLYSWHGGVTRAIRDNNTFLIEEKTRRLNSFVDEIFN